MSSDELPRRAVVLGLARSGEAAALVLARRGVHVVGIDARADLDAGRLRAAGVEVRLGAAADAALPKDVELLVKSPGVPSETPLVLAARARGLPVWSEIELGARIVRQPEIGVTGTNGKTTTTALLGAVYRAAGRPVAVAGNIGRSLCSLDGDIGLDEAIVCELSSFQLEDIETLRPRVAVLLNLTPDHLDRHGSVDAYRDAKLRIFENQTPDDVAVVPEGFTAIAGPCASRRVLGRRRASRRATDSRRAQPRERSRRNGRESSRRDSRQRDRRGASFLSGCRPSAGADP